MQVYLIGSGPFDPDFFQTYIKDQADLNDDSKSAFVGVDLGAQRLLDMGLTVDLAVGDFDSISEADFENLSQEAKRIEKLEPMKDETDTEHALAMVGDLYPDAEYHLFGMLNGRVDHLLSNIWLIFQEKFHSIIQQIHLVEENNRINFLLPGTHQVDRIKDMQYLSFVAMTPVESLSLSNVVYELDNYQMATPLALVSNEFLPEVDQMTIAFEEGLILSIQTQDGEG